MSSLSTVEARLPPGFRFHPRDDELICDYLMKWVRGCAHQSPFLIEVDLNKCEPWDIPETACVGSKEWYFYSQRDRKYATGVRTNRATISGYWKATGKDRPVLRKAILVGMRKTLVFYQGRAPKGRKTDWVMHEFRLEGILGPGPKIASAIKEDCVLCRVFHKNTTAEVAAKQDTTGSSANYDHITTSSSPSLPELVEPYTTFEHSQAGANVVNEQVPCFSIFTPNQTNPTFSLIDPCPEILPTKSMVPNSTGILLPHNSGESSCPNSHHDKNALKAVLNHLTKMDSNNYGILMKDSPSFAEGSPDSYLSGVRLSSMWNQYS